MQEKQVLDDASEEVFNKLSTTLKSYESKHKEAAKGYNNVFSLLASITSRAPTQADQGMVKTVADILDQLQENLDNSVLTEKKN